MREDRQLIRERVELLTTNCIVAETHTLLLNRFGYAIALPHSKPSCQTAIALVYYTQSSAASFLYRQSAVLRWHII